MNMKELAQKINSDRDFRNRVYSGLKQELEEERNKPVHKRDYEKIDRLSHDICELLEGERQEDYSENINRLYGRFEEYEKSRRKSLRSVRKIIPAICCAAVMLAANCFTVLAWNMNIVTAVIQFTKGGFSVDFDNSKPQAIELPVSENDPYGIIAECAKYDIYPETPHYLPDGFYLEHVDSNVDKNFANIVSFTFKKDNMSIGLDFMRYWNETGRVGIPSDHYNISETKVNGYPAIVSKEDNQYTITFRNDDTAFLMFTQDVPYEECEKIVDSIR